MAVQGQFGQIIIGNSPKTRQLDVCVLPFSTPFEFLIDVWFRPIPAEMLLTKSVIDDRWVGVRDELVMSGLPSVTYGQDVFLLQLQARILGPLSQTFKRGKRLSDDQVEVWRATKKARHRQHK